MYTFKCSSFFPILQTDIFADVSSQKSSEVYSQRQAYQSPTCQAAESRVFPLIAFVSRRHWLRGTVRCERKKATLRIAALHYSAELTTLWARTGDRDVHCWDLASDAGVANHIAYVRHSSYSVPTPSLVTDRSARECSMLITRGRAVQRHLVVLI
jgi:hypothetical protein